MIQVKFKQVRFPELDLVPIRQTAGAVGWDVKAALRTPKVLYGGQTLLVSTGIAVELPEGYYFQLWARSGLAAKSSISNLAGIIDTDYRGEIHVILQNHRTLDYTIQPAERIGQLLLCQEMPATFVPVEELNETDRGVGGFGSTGKK